MTSASPAGSIAMNDDLHEAYRRTAYTFVDGDKAVELRIDVPSRELASLHVGRGAKSSAYLTAFNPKSMKLSDDANQARNAALLSDLGVLGYKTLAGQGAVGGWAEASFFIPGLSLETAWELAVRHGQNAFVHAGADATPRLILVDHPVVLENESKHLLLLYEMVFGTVVCIDALSCGPRDKAFGAISDLLLFNLSAQRMLSQAMQQFFLVFDRIQQPIAADQMARALDQARLFRRQLYEVIAIVRMSAQ
jgi:hypothetical protein